METIAKPIKRSRRADSVPFDEMRRLMRVYGPIKCLRKRQTSGGIANAKIDSVKRKFYRWFPDLEERFVKDAAGFYRPKFGHEFEMRYREDMRTRDGETLTKKRTKNRKPRLGGKRDNTATAESKKATNSPNAKSKQDATASTLSNTTPLALTGCTPVIAVTPPVVHSYSDLRLTRLNGTDIPLDLDNDRTASASIIADTEPLERSFIAEQGIFDDVEDSFFGFEVSHAHNYAGPQCVQSCPRLESSSTSSSSSEEEPRSTKCWDSDSTSSIDNMLAKSMEEYCEEILASDADSATSFHFNF